MPFDFELSRDLVHDAHQHGLSLSAFLETQDPSTNWDGQDRELGAFRRQLKRYDIRTEGDYANGIPSDNWGRFWSNAPVNSDDPTGDGTHGERACLAAEWCRTEFKRMGRIVSRSQIDQWQNPMKNRFPVDVPVDFTIYPPAVFDQLRYQMLQPSALSYLISRTRMIDAGTFKALYLSDSAAQTAARMSRVEEFAEIPTVQFVTSENSNDVHKYGRRLKISYEQDRRMSLDMVSWAIAYIAAKADIDKETSAIDVLINGDGNVNTAATNTSGSTLDAAAAGALTLKMWLAWRYLWTRPYMANVIVAAPASLVSTFLLSAGSANLAAANYLGTNMSNAMNITPVRTLLDGVIAVDNAGVAANTLLALDANYTLEMIQEVNSDILETDRVISNQYTDITMTESIGWSVATLGQNRTLAYTV